MWVYDAEAERIIQRDISYVPGLYKIFDEILVNAADNKQRDAKMNLIKITINKLVFIHEISKIGLYSASRTDPIHKHYHLHSETRNFIYFIYFLFNYTFPFLGRWEFRHVIARGVKKFTGSWQMLWYLIMLRAVKNFQNGCKKALFL